MQLNALFRLAFASAPWLNHLTLLHTVTRRPILQKVRDQTNGSCRIVLSLLVSIQFQVLFHSPPGVLFTVPSRYCALSVTRSYLALRDGPRSFTPDSTCPVLLWIPLGLMIISITGLLPCFAYLSRYVLLLSFRPTAGSEPLRYYYLRFGLMQFRSPLLSQSFVYFLFLQVLRCFSSLGSPHYTMYSCNDTCALSQVRFRIRKSTDHSSFATPRSLSQLVTSFIGA